MNNNLSIKVRYLLFLISLRSPFKTADYWRKVWSWKFILWFPLAYFYYLPNRYRNIKKQYLIKRQILIEQI